MKINQKASVARKRELYLEFELDGRHFDFEYREEECNFEDTSFLKVDGKKYNFTIISGFKHNLQAYFEVPDNGDIVFIDRRYQHNRGFDVYFQGKHYSVDEK